MPKTTEIAAADDKAFNGLSNIKNFRSSPDVENLYRFIMDSNLRHEAKTLLRAVLGPKDEPKRKRRARKKKQTLQ